MSVTSTLMNCFIPRTLSDILPKWGVECNQPSALIIGPHVACSFVDHDGHDALSLGIVLFGSNCFHCLVLPPPKLHRLHVRHHNLLACTVQATGLASSL
jgi:hypothetical protein